MDLWWDAVPQRCSRLSGALGVVLRDGHHLRALPLLAAAAPPAALLVGFIAGWRHPLATDLYTTSLFLMALGLLVGVMSAAVGFWLVLGYAAGDIILGVRGAAFSGSFASVGTTWAALLLTDAILALLIVLIPITARVLAGELAVRWLPGRGPIPGAAIAAVAAAALTFAWTQAALVLTRPFFSWHKLE